MARGTLTTHFFGLLFLRTPRVTIGTGKIRVRRVDMHAFLSGSEHRRRVWSILVSDLVFAAAHAHISIAFAVAAFIPGLLWGWMFARTNSLIAVAASHFLIGGTSIYLLGIEGLVAKLMG